MTPPGGRVKPYKFREGNGMSKKQNRKSMPEWKKLVDRDMRLYLTWGRVMEHQADLLLTLELTGARVTPAYELREGSAGGPAMNQVEKIAVTKDFARKKIAGGQQYRANLEEIVRIAAGGDPDKETFVYRYWLTSETTVRQRSALVVAALPFLAHRSWKTGKIGKPNSTFYAWRAEMYEKIGELLGYFGE